MSADPRGRALRIGRCSETGRVYLVTSVTHLREPVFRDLRHGRILVRELRRQDSLGHTATIAFVVMPDHFHWLLQLLPRASLPRVLASVKGRSARAIHELRPGTAGKLWQSGFHDHAVRRDEDIVRLARYVVANPIRAGLVRRLGEYSLWDAMWM